MAVATQQSPRTTQYSSLMVRAMTEQFWHLVLSGDLIQVDRVELIILCCMLIAEVMNLAVQHLQPFSQTFTCMKSVATSVSSCQQSVSLGIGWGISTSASVNIYYRAMHFSAKRGIAIACRLSVRPSVRPSVCDVGELWSHRLEFFENNFTVS